MHFLMCVCLCISSTTGEEVINKLAMEYRKAGREREEIKLVDLEEAISKSIDNSSTSK